MKDTNKDAPVELDEAELFWRDHEPWLKSCGYQLRRRYRPGWVPAWTNRKTSLFWWEFEDSVKAKHPSVMDAKSTSDGTRVMLKRVRVSEHPTEVEITRHLSSIVDKTNHSPLLKEVLTIPNEDDLRILVFPLLRRFDDPEFDTIGEAVEFFRQIIEGVQFLHHHHIAHRDVGVLNILMDTSMFPAGYHPAAPSRTLDFQRKAKHLPRTLARPRYFLIDFGLSVRFDDTEKTPLADPVRGQDKTVPEFANGTFSQYDPFPTDIYYLGNLIREHFLEGKNDVKPKRGLDFMEPLLQEMCAALPSDRPTIDIVAERFQGLVGTINLRQRLRSKDEGIWRAFCLDVAHICRRLKYSSRGIPP